MKTNNQKQLEIAIFKANTAMLDGWNIYWLLSKIQVEYILPDIAPVASNADQPNMKRAQYQEETLPVLSLEKYYGHEEITTSSAYRYIVTKIPMATGGMKKVILRTSNPIRIRKLTFNATQAQHTGLNKNSEDILGAFTLPDNQLVIVPDLASILSKVV